MREALQAVDSPDELHALIVDMGLPDGSGLDVLRRWAVRRVGAPAALLTSRHEETLWAKLALHHNARYIPKPLETADWRVFEADVEAHRWGLERPMGTRFSKFVTKEKLSASRAELLALLIRGVPHKDIAGRLGIALDSVKQARVRLLEQLEATTVEAVVAKILSDG
jgi:FixJ family two-component response regulator